MAKLKEAVEEKKKLIATLRNKPLKMKKKMEVLKYDLSVILFYYCRAVILFCCCRAIICYIVICLLTTCG